jgi:hypothetical protein
MKDRIHYKQPKKIESLESLKSIARSLQAPENTARCIDGFIVLSNGLARSSKTIHYYPAEEDRLPKRMRRVWDVFEHICDTWTECTDVSLGTKTNILEAIESGAFYVESIDYM